VDGGDAVKPHEEQWQHNGTEEVVRTSENYIRAAVYGAGCGGAPAHEVAHLLSAAPDMARALLAFLSDYGHTPE
jgi:hypothetical protein